MPYFLNNSEDQKTMLESIGVKSIDDLFTMVPRELRLDRPIAVPPALGELELTAHIERLGGEEQSGGQRGLLPRRRKLRPFHPGGRRFYRLAERIRHVLHALSAGSQPRQPPGPVRVSDADQPVDRDGLFQFEPVRRRQRGGGGRADGDERHSPAWARAGRQERTPRLPADPGHISGQSGRRTGRARYARRDARSGDLAGRRQRQDGLPAAATAQLLRLRGENRDAGPDRSRGRRVAGRQRRSDQPRPAQTAGRRGRRTS